MKKKKKFVLQTIVMRVIKTDMIKIYLEREN